MPLFFIIIVLLLLIGAAGVTLLLDARQRRMDRQVAIALSGPLSESAPSVRRTPVASRDLLFHRLGNYRPGIEYIWRPQYVLIAGLAAAVAVFYANSFLGYSLIYVSSAAIIVAVMVIRSLFAWQRRRLANQLFRQLPDTIEMVTSAVRSGLPVNEAFRNVAREMPRPTSGQFAIVCSEMSLGRPPEDAIEGVYRRTQVAEYGFFAVTLAVQMKSGGGLTETLQTLADTVRQRVTLAARAKAMAGEVIFSSRALSVAPLIIGGLLYTLNPQLEDLLFSDPTGRNLLTYAITSVIVGSLVIRWMVRRNTSL
jgi:tight adherence protein B